ncbi:MAG: SDR family NAD(P)-dependent oxidoreductase [Gammaproteobacteria bacterium]|nr:SDR family NAD(P)-dependent oxidoreductase [Gammaproteobacteria bacterium]
MNNILITGASSGIGLQLSKDYLSAGHKVYACGRNENKLKQQLKHYNAQYLTFDTTDAEQTQQTLSKIENLDLVILNAGDCSYVDDAKNFNSQQVKHIMDVNFMGTIYCLEALLPKLKKGAHIAVMSSSATYLPLTRSESYGASKAALDYFIRSMAIDLMREGLTFSLIKPGFVDTPLTQKNDFPMPGKVSVEKASAIIRKGLLKHKQTISFPRGFIFTMRLFSILPESLWNLLAAKMVKTA